MKYAEEDFAADLHRVLIKRFSTSVPPTVISIEGAGVHWHCTAERDNSYCSIDCFDVGGPEYFTSFKRDAKELATLRTPSMQNTLSAVGDWLQGRELSFLYEKYPFVDHTKRALSRICDNVITNAPELGRSANPELHHEMADIYCLRFRLGDRSCEISFYGTNRLPDVRCAWDECELFQFQSADYVRLASVLNRWVCDRAMPSEMRTEFSWLEIYDLADYYENGRGIEGEFIKSWESIEYFYTTMGFPFSSKVQKFVAALRQKGYDKSLRAGQSLWSLILSRSRRHGLRPDQPCIAFWFHNNGMDVYDYLEGIAEDKKVTYPRIELTPEIEDKLRELQTKPID